MSKIAGVLISLMALVIVACGSAPPHSICQRDAERYIKRELAFPASYDEHELDTVGVGQELGKVTADEEGGWIIESIILFGAKNAFGVKQDHLLHYMTFVDSDDNCGSIMPIEFRPYQR